MSGPIGRRRKRIESTRNNPDLLVAFCLIGAVAGLMSLAIARDLGEVVALVLFVLGVSTIPLGLRGGLRLEHAKVAALILVLGLLVYMAQSATVQEFNQLYWFGVLPLAGGLLMGRRGIVLGGGLAFFATTLITLSYSTDAEEGSFSSPFFIDANVFVLSVVFMTFVYERMYGRALLRAERNLAAEARSRQRLARSEAELRAILDHEPQCVKQVSRKGALLDMNPAGLRLIGYDSVEEVRGMDVRDLVVPEHRERFEEDLDAVFRGEKRVRRFEITTRDGTRRWMEQHAAPLLDDEKNVVSLLAVSHEVTEQMRTE
ncbi:MAG: PAS domain S-box protein, partial [Myxococcota bacterium]